MPPSFCGGIGKTQMLFCLLINITLRRYQCWKQREAYFFLCLLFICQFFFFFPFSDVSVCSQHLGQGLGSVWLYLKHRGKRLVPAPLSPNRLFAWCGCQVDALASFPRTNEFARICVWKKACFSRFFFFLGGITVDGCMPDADHLSCQKGTSLDSTMNY